MLLIALYTLLYLRIFSLEYELIRIWRFFSNHQSLGTGTEALIKYINKDPAEKFYQRDKNVSVIIDGFFFFVCKNDVQYYYSFATDYNWHSGLMMWSCDNDSSSNYSSEVRTGS